MKAINTFWFFLTFQGVSIMVYPIPGEPLCSETGQNSDHRKPGVNGKLFIYTLGIL